MNQTLLGIFSGKEDANSAIVELEESGYNPKDISIVIKDDLSHRHEKVGAKGGAAFSGIISGATAGGVIGGLTGLLISVGAIAIPGIGALLIGGPIAAALGLTGAAAATVSGATTGILAGGLVGGLVDLGVPESVAVEYEDRIREGAILLAVPARSADDEAKIRSVFQRFNADQIRSVNNSL